MKFKNLGNLVLMYNLFYSGCSVGQSIGIDKGKSDLREGLEYKIDLKREDSKNEVYLDNLDLKNDFFICKRYNLDENADLLANRDEFEDILEMDEKIIGRHDPMSFVAFVNNRNADVDFSMKKLYSENHLEVKNYIYKIDNNHWIVSYPAGLPLGIGKYSYEWKIDGDVVKKDKIEVIDRDFISG